jgi:DNA-binding HxlR family transcriptional regulator
MPKILANKWAHLVICALGSNSIRFGELRGRIERVTPKMLTQTLRVLERDGLVEREIHPVIPPRVEYRMTKVGQELTVLLDAILLWPESHAPEYLRLERALNTMARRPSRRRRPPEI